MSFIIIQGSIMQAVANNVHNIICTYGGWLVITKQIGAT